MTSREQLDRVFTRCASELNQHLESHRSIGDSPDTVLLGEGSALDSLTIVNLLISLEERAESIMGSRIDVLDAVLTGEEQLYTRADIIDYMAARLSS